MRRRRGDDDRGKVPEDAVPVAAGGADGVWRSVGPIDMRHRGEHPAHNLPNQFVQVRQWTMSWDCGVRLVNDPARGGGGGGREERASFVKESTHWSTGDEYLNIGIDLQ